MKYQLVLQWPASSIDDYDSMIEIENLLIEKLTDDSEVDGHDAGSGEMNIFIRTSSPEQAFVEVRDILSDRTPARAAFREMGKEKYKVLWPKGSKEFSVS